MFFWELSQPYFNNIIMQKGDTLPYDSTCGESTANDENAQL